MINIAIAVGIALGLSLLMIIPLGVHPAISIPFGVIAGLAAFIFLGRKVQEALEGVLAQMQRDMQAGKLDRAIETLKRGFAFKNRHIFIGSQLNSQIGMIHYIKKEHDAALDYLKKGFVKHYVGQCMMAIIHYKRKDYDAMKKVMEATVQSNKKESICYGLYAYLLVQLKDKEKAMDILRQGLKKLPNDERLTANLTLLQNNKKMKMKVYGDLWAQFMLERAPRMMQEQPRHMRMSRKAMFR